MPDTYREPKELVEKCGGHAADVKNIHDTMTLVPPISTFSRITEKIIKGSADANNTSNLLVSADVDNATEPLLAEPLPALETIESTLKYIPYDPNRHYLIIDLEDPFSTLKLLSKPGYVQVDSAGARNHTEAYEQVVFSHSDDRYLVMDTKDRCFKRYMKSALFETLRSCSAKEACTKVMGEIFGLSMPDAGAGLHAGEREYIIIDRENPLARSETIREADNAHTYEKTLFSRPGHRYMAVESQADSNPRPLNTDCIQHGKCQKYSNVKKRSPANHQASRVRG